MSFFIYSSLTFTIYYIFIQSYPTLSIIFYLIVINICFSFPPYYRMDICFINSQTLYFFIFIISLMNSKYFKTQDDFDILDVHQLFNYYNTYFFQGKLEKCYVQWSQRMTLCAGTCTHSSYDSCTIKLSAPLLKYRTSNQVKETLLHQMIHAFLFLTNPSACLTEGGHGKQFKQIMNNINEITSLNLSIYHNFRDEVDLHRKHIWRCNGLCKEKPPFYGYVKRAMNRKPQPADPWFKDHQRTCGGQFIKQSEPQTSKEKKEKNKIKEVKKQHIKTIQEYFNQDKKNGQKGQKVKQKRLISNKQKSIEHKQKQKQKQNSLGHKQSQKSIFLGKGKSIADYCSEINQQSKK